MVIQKVQHKQIVVALLFGLLPQHVFGYAAPTASPTTAPTPVPTSDNTLPIAMNQLVVVNPGDSALVKLRGYSTKTASLSYEITTIPSSGNLYQLSQVYSTYGYEPKGGSQITAAETTVTGSGNRVYYKRPVPDAAGYNNWDTITFTISDGMYQSYAGIVYFVPPSGALVGSSFLLGSEGWTITGNKQTYNATFEPFSRGALLNHYIYGSEDDINVMTSGERDRSLWYFEAPSSYLGNYGIAYGGALKFTLGAFSGDFSKTNGKDVHAVVLECSSCTGPVGAGIRLALPISALPLKGSFDGTATKFSIQLLESAGWLKDPQNTLKSWTAASKCDLIQVLSRLSAFRILGDWTTWYESVALDDVMFVNTKSVLPLCAMSRPDASICTC